jgi:hypothetical protein
MCGHNQDQLTTVFCASKQKLVNSVLLRARAFPGPGAYLANLRTGFC